MKVFKVGSKGWGISIPSSGARSHTLWDLLPGDLLFVEDVGDISSGIFPFTSFDVCYALIKINYQSVNDSSGVVKGCWLNFERPINNPIFGFGHTNFHGITEVIRYVEAYKNGSQNISVSLGTLLEDITTQWIRDNKLEEIGL